MRRSFAYGSRMTAENKQRPRQARIPCGNDKPKEQEQEQEQEQERKQKRKRK
jgi:hypothetical protein